MAAEPLRLLQRRYFGNVSAEFAIKSLQWSADSKLLLMASQSHVIKVYAPLERSSRFSQCSLTDNAEIIGAYFKNNDNYDVSY